MTADIRAVLARRIARPTPASVRRRLARGICLLVVALLAAPLASAQADGNDGSPWRPTTDGRRPSDAPAKPGQSMKGNPVKSLPQGPSLTAPTNPWLLIPERDDRDRDEATAPPQPVVVVQGPPGGLFVLAVMDDDDRVLDIWAAGALPDEGRWRLPLPELPPGLQARLVLVGDGAQQDELPLPLPPEPDLPLLEVAASDPDDDPPTPSGSPPSD